MRNTRKKILAMILALVMAMSITASAADISNPDIGPAENKDDITAYTDENCKGTILKMYIKRTAGLRNPDGTRIIDYIAEPYTALVDEMTSDPNVKSETSIGNMRETWDYLAEHFNKVVADKWFHTEWSNAYNENAEFPHLEWLLKDGDRQTAYVYNNTDPKTAWDWMLRNVCSMYFTAPTDADIIHDYPPKAVTTPEPTATQPINNTQTNMAPVTVTPGEVMTVTVNEIPMQLEAVVITDANGGATTYFKLRDVGDAVGFQVDWTAATGITITTD